MRIILWVCLRRWLSQWNSLDFLVFQIFEFSIQTKYFIIIYDQTHLFSQKNSQNLGKIWDSMLQKSSKTYFATIFKAFEIKISFEIDVPITMTISLKETELYGSPVDTHRLFYAVQNRALIHLEILFLTFSAVRSQKIRKRWLEFF